MSRRLIGDIKQFRGKFRTNPGSHSLPKIKLEEVIVKYCAASFTMLYDYLTYCNFRNAFLLPIHGGKYCKVWTPVPEHS